MLAPTPIHEIMVIMMVIPAPPLFHVSTVLSITWSINILPFNVSSSIVVSVFAFVLPGSLHFLQVVY